MMFGRDNLKWLARGLAAASLILLVVAGTTIGRAQGSGSNPNLDSLVVEEPPAGPGPEGAEEGRALVGGEEPSNAAAAAADTAAEMPGGAGPEPELVVVAVPPTADGEELLNWEVNAAPSAGGAEGTPSLIGPEDEDLLARAYGSPLVIPAADFREDGGATHQYWFSFAGGYFRGTGTYDCFMAPAHLPDGATLAWFYASVYKNAAGNVYVNLRRVNRQTGGTNLMAQVLFDTNSTSIQSEVDGSIDYATVDYPTYAYYVHTCFTETAHRLYSIRIYYTE